MIASVGSRQMPYPGLRPFEAEDAPLFFGREAQVSVLLRQLEDHQFVAVVGSSGSGKSSLVRAGLLPAVREGFLLGTTDWLVLLMKPGQYPFQGLAHALRQANSESPVGSAGTAPAIPEQDKTLATLRTADRGLLLALANARLALDQNVMVLVDQFEELFAFRRSGARRDDVIPRDEAAGFVKLLLRACSDPEGRVWVVLTMRSDFIGDCEAFLGLPEAVSRSQFLVPRLDRSQMEEAIVRPGEVDGTAFRPFSFEDGLVNTIINEAGDRPDQLPLMQHALMRTWKRAIYSASVDGDGLELKHKDYGDVGRIGKALSEHADEAWKKIEGDPKKAQIARQLFLQLCDISPDGQITRRRPRVAEVISVTGASIAEIREVVRVFQEDDRNFILPSAESLGSEDLLDISHEALLRQWRRFTDDWQAQERDDASELRRLAELASLHSRGKGGLLPAADLARITDWQTRISAEWAQRYVKKETWEGVLAFIKASRATVQREAWQRLILGIVLVAATLVWAVFSYRAETTKAADQGALTNSYVQSIGVSYRDSISSDELTALWELAELDPSNAKVRELVIDQWFQTAASVERALNRDARGLRAAIGTNPELPAYTVRPAKELADSLMKDPKVTDADLLSRLAEALAGLAAKMEPKEAAGFAGHVVTVLEDPKETDADLLSRLAEALAGLAAKMEPKEAARLVDRVVTVLEDPKETDADRLSALADALAGLTAKMEPKEAATVAGRGAQHLVGLLENPKETDAGRLSSIERALAELAAKMEPKEAARLADRVVTVLEDPKETDADRLSALADALAGLAAKMERKEAAAVAGSGAQHLVGLLEDPKVTGADRLSALAAALAGLSTKMEIKEAAALAGRGAQRLVGLLEDPKETDADGLSTLAAALAGLATKMELKEAAAVAGRGAQRLVGLLEDPKVTGAYNLSTLADALAGLATKMELKEAAAVAGRGAQRLVGLLEDPKETDADRLSALADTLAGLAAKMEPKEAAAVAGGGAQRLVGLLKDPKETDAGRLSSLGRALAELAAKMEPKEAAPLADIVAQMLGDPKEIDADRLSALADALAGLTAKMEPKEAAAVAGGGAPHLVGLLGNPKVTAADRLFTLGRALATLSLKIPMARQTRLLALSYMLLRHVRSQGGESEDPRNDRKVVVRLCEELGRQDLAEVLKWPFAVGEAETIVLASLETKTGKQFAGNLWKFVEQAQALGIKDIERPAKRPRAEDALKQLDELATAPRIDEHAGGIDSLRNDGAVRNSRHLNALRPFLDTDAQETM